MKKISLSYIGLFLLVLMLGLSACSSKKKISNAQKRDLKAAFTDLKHDVPEALVTYEDNQVKLVFPEAVLFEVYSTEILPSYMPTMAKIAKVLNKYPDVSVLITGYTDTSGSDELNDKLSWGRAESAKQALLQYEVKNKRIYTWGFGSKNPVASNATAEGRKQNRRVEMVILYDFQDEFKNKYQQ